MSHVTATRDVIVFKGSDVSNVGGGRGFLVKVGVVETGIVVWPAGDVVVVVVGGGDDDGQADQGR